jgi:hypothetical protein
MSAASVIYSSPLQLAPATSTYRASVAVAERRDNRLRMKKPRNVTVDARRGMTSMTLP